MLRICIFSENKNLENGLQKIFQTYIYEKMIKAEIKVFEDLKSLLKSDISGAILFIGDGEKRSALRAAQILRENDHTEEIVIVTDNIEYVYEAFKVSAYRVLNIPIARMEVFEALDSFMKGKRTKNVVIIKNGAERLTLSLNEIIYVASVKRSTGIVTKSGLIPTCVALFRLEAQLPDEYFFLCHRAFIINLMNIKSVSPDISSAVMLNGEEIPISRRRKADFIAARENYIDKNIFNVI